MNPDTGLKVSNPLAVDQGSPLALTWSWTFRAVMSMARAEEEGRKGELELEKRDGLKERDKPYPATWSIALADETSLAVFPMTTPSSTGDGREGKEERRV